LAYVDRPGTSEGPTGAIGRLEYLRGSTLGFRNLIDYIARSPLETGGLRPRLHSGLRRARYPPKSDRPVATDHPTSDVHSAAFVDRPVQERKEKIGTNNPLDAAIGDLYVAVQNAEMASLLVPKPGEGSQHDARTRADGDVDATLRRARALGASNERLNEEIGPRIYQYLD
jgi:hypothetical protein